MRLETDWGRFTYAYDGAGQLTGVTDPGYPNLGIPSGRSTLQYDPAGRETRREYPNGAVTTTAYDPAGPVWQKRHAGSDGTELDRALYQRDALGRPLGKATREGEWRYGYDARGQLRSEQAPDGTRSTWTYDPAGRRETAARGTSVTTSVYDAADQLRSATSPAGAILYSYDANGNRTEANDPDGVRTFVWDARDRLRESVLPDGTAGGIARTAARGAEQLQEQQAIVQQWMRGLGLQPQFVTGPPPPTSSPLVDKLRQVATLMKKHGQDNSETVKKIIEATQTQLKNEQRWLTTSEGMLERLKKKGFEGVKRTENGGPDFSGTRYLYPVGPGQKNVVRIKLRGGREKDFDAANGAGGFVNGKPDGYTWHHLDDFDPATGEVTMQLITTPAHQATFPHRGGVAQWERHHGKKYKR